MSTVKTTIREFGEKKEQATLELEVIRENAKTVWVRLPDGHLIKRHKTKQLVSE